jgi:hypothetical protein
MLPDDTNMAGNVHGGNAPSVFFVFDFVFVFVVFYCSIPFKDNDDPFLPYLPSSSPVPIDGCYEGTILKMIESSGHIVATRHCNESHPEVTTRG